MFASGEVEDPFLKFHFSLLIAMAASGGYNYRDGTQRSSHKVDRPLSLNSNPKSSVKSKALPASGPRRNSTGSIGGGGAGPATSKNDTGGEFRILGCDAFCN